MKERRIRWSDQDKCFGPFIYSKDGPNFKSYTLVLGSGDDDGGRAACRLRLSGFGHTFIVALPAIIRPWKKKVLANWDAETVKRLGRGWYWETHEREYGLSYHDGHLSVHYGRQTLDSSTEQRWGRIVPWTQWRHVRRSLYGLAGEHFWTEPRRGKGRSWDFDAIQSAERDCPSLSFQFTDFDGERLTARTIMEEREWRFGEGWFKWLSLFRKPKVKRSLDIRFSGETGRRKGSWKGGTLGHGIEMLPGEMHEAAFRRYCADHEMAFVGKITSEGDVR